MKYKKLFKIEEQSTFPKVLNIETTNVCNLKCPMCPRTTLMDRPAVHMEMATFEKIVEEAAIYGVGAVWLHVFGEPILHPNIGEMIRLLKKHDNIKNVGLSSNCNLLTEERSRIILEAGLDRIILSLDAVDKMTYKRVRGGAYDKAVRNVKTFLETRRQLKAPTTVQISCIDMQLNHDEVAAFQEQWAGLLQEGEEVMIKPFTNFGGTITEISAGAQSSTEELVPCRKLWTAMTILSKGEVVACCYDVNGELPVGNLANATLAEIWKGPELHRLRQIHREERFSEIPQCFNCSAIRKGNKDRPATE